MKKRSFFERLTGAINMSDEESTEVSTNIGTSGDIDADEADAELAIDVYQTPNDIVVKTIVAGVRPEDLQINLSREMVTISGAREEAREVEKDGYFHQELYWGSFSRSVLLPEEVDVEEAVAEEKNGLLTIRLPKIDKKRQTKLRVRSS